MKLVYCTNWANTLHCHSTMNYISFVRGATLHIIHIRCWIGKSSQDLLFREKNYVMVDVVHKLIRRRLYSQLGSHSACGRLWYKAHAAQREKQRIGLIQRRQTCSGAVPRSSTSRNLCASSLSLNPTPGPSLTLQEHMAYIPYGFYEWMPKRKEQLEYASWRYWLNKLIEWLYWRGK